jgi:hypothetical protein
MTTPEIASELAVRVASELRRQHGDCHTCALHDIWSDEVQEVLDTAKADPEGGLRAALVQLAAELERYTEDSIRNDDQLEFESQGRIQGMTEAGKRVRALLAEKGVI